MQAIHKKLKFSCSKCEFEAKSLSKLSLHKNSEHKRKEIQINSFDLKATDVKSKEDSEEKRVNYFCSMCDNIYYEKESLKAHIKSHT